MSLNSPALTSIVENAPLRRRLRLRQQIGFILNSTRLRLFVALLGGVLGANMVCRGFDIYQDPTLSYSNTVLGTTLAVLSGLMIYRKMTSLPGTAALMNTLPAFALSYISVTALFYALGLDFSRREFGVSFVLVVSLMFVLGFAARRLRQRPMGFISSPATQDLTQLDFMDWVPVRSYKELALWPELPLVADLGSPDLPDHWARTLAEEAIAGRQIYNVRQLRESLLGQVEIDRMTENVSGHLSPDSIYGALKYYIDRLIGLAALLVLSPLLVLIGLAIRLDSPGPALFRQTRMGYRGQTFTIFKFRSMRQADEQGPEDLSRDMTRSDDDRITATGRIIRKLRIDELPQLINIVRGEMSLIGPRPETLNLSRWYEQEIPFYRYRHIVRPGITGWAQVKQGHVTSVEDVHAKLRFDLFYVRNFSIWLDILIIVHTIRVVLTGHGAK